LFYFFAAFFIAVSNLTAIKILLPDIMASLDIELNWLAWVVNAYSLPLAVFVPIAGRIGDVYGPRRFFILGILGLAVGSLICGIAFSLPLLIAGRVLQGLGAAFLIPNALNIILSMTDSNRRGRILGKWSSIGATGAILGPVAAGLLLDALSWRGTFLVIAGLALIITVAAYKNIHMHITMEQTRVRVNEIQSFDLAGAALLVTATTVVLLGITLLPDWGWKNTWIHLSVIVFILLIYLFYRLEKSTLNPILNTNLLKQPRFSLGLIVGFLVEFAMAGTFLALPIFFIIVHGYDAVFTALLLTPAAAAVVVAAPLGGRFSDRFGPGLPITIGMVLRLLSFIMLSQVGVETAYPYIAVALVLNGISFGFTAVPSLNSVISAVSTEQHGIASGAHNMFRFTGAAMGTTIGGIVLYATMPATFTSLSGPLSGFREVYLLGAAACLPGIVAGFWLKSIR